MIKESFNKAKWANFKEDFKNQYGEMPSVIGVLFIIGLSEVNNEIDELSKEQKEEVIHVGLCTLLEREDIYERLANDDDGWPHFRPTKKAQLMDIEKQEPYLRKLILKYFNYD